MTSVVNDYIKIYNRGVVLFVEQKCVNKKIKLWGVLRVIQVLLTKMLPIMLALCSILSYTNYAQNYAGIISWSLATSCV